MLKSGMENSIISIRINEVNTIFINFNNYVHNMKMVELHISLVTFAKYLFYNSSLFNIIPRKVLK